MELEEFFWIVGLILKIVLLWLLVILPILLFFKAIDEDDNEIGQE